MKRLLKPISIALQILGVLYIVEKGVSLYFLGKITGLPAAISNYPAKTDEVAESLTLQRGAGWADADQAEFSTGVLKSMGIEYTEQIIGDVHWVRWKPIDKAIEEEIFSRVSQYQFVRDVCPQLPLPKPDEQSKEGLSCQNE